MKTLILLLFSCLTVWQISAQQPNVVKLNEPSKTRGIDMMTVFQERKSTNEYQSKDLSLQDLSDLLWTANGINRPENGKKTAPSALNSQDIDIYVCHADGAYLYDAAKNEMIRVSGKDLRPLMNGSRPNDAPVLLLLVADLSRYQSYKPYDTEANKRLRDMSALDAGTVSQNISLFCASSGLGTRPRASMDHEKLQNELSLKESQIPWMNHPVGYPKE
ncbi:MAG: nitroreductase family protein [Paludibacteraceae bacterium]